MSEAPASTGFAWVGLDFDGKLVSVSVEMEGDDGPFEDPEDEFDHEQFARRGAPNAYRCTLTQARELMIEHGWVPHDTGQGN